MLFMEQPAGGVKVSFRSRRRIDVARIAEQFGGGGHRLASGATLATTLMEAEARVLADWCDEHRFRSIVFVSTRDHSRRLRRVLQRSMEGHQTRITVRPARHSPFDPDRWWETRSGVRTEIIEFQKLLLDLIRHPIG